MINKKCPLVLTNLYHYDISKCYYSILNNLGWDISDINVKEKDQRNIKIGLLQKDNPSLAKYLINSTNNIIDTYLIDNNINIDKDLIVRQKDGIIITKKLNNTNISIPIDFRYSILRIFISIDRKSFISVKNNGEIVVNGVSEKPVDTSFYKLFSNINISSKRTLIDSIEKIRQSIFNSTNIKWFAIPTDDGFNIPIKNGSMIKLNLSSLDIIDHNDIDKYYIWKKYIWIFCRSIIITYC